MPIGAKPKGGSVPKRPMYRDFITGDVRHPQAESLLDY